MAFPQGWTKKRQLTIAAAQVGSGGVTSFTVMLLVTAASAKADGSDLRVTTASDGSGLLTVDVIHAAGSGVFWVRVGPLSLSSASANTLWLWSGNASASAQTGSDAYGSAWRGYWPLGGGSDRTANAANGTAVGGVTIGGISGKSGLATTYDGANDASSVTTLGNLGSSMASGLEYQAWIQKANSADIDALFGTVSDGSTMYVGAEHNSTIAGGSVEADSIRLVFRGADGQLRTGGATSLGIIDTLWHSVVCAITPSAFEVLVDNTAKTITYGSTGTPASFANFQYPVTIGARNLRSVLDLFALSSFDEIKIFLGPRSAAWRTTEFNALNNPAAFLTQDTENSIGLLTHRRKAAA